MGHATAAAELDPAGPAGRRARSGRGDETGHQRPDGPDLEAWWAVRAGRPRPAGHVRLIARTRLSTPATRGFPRQVGLKSLSGEISPRCAALCTSSPVDWKPHPWGGAARLDRAASAPA